MSAGVPVPCGPVRQWQIEGLRRIEIPEAMQKQHGFKPLGAATGPVKTAIFGGNNARLYDIDPQRAANEIARDQLSSIRLAYEAEGAVTLEPAVWLRDGSYGAVRF